MGMMKLLQCRKMLSWMLLWYRIYKNSTPGPFDCLSPNLMAIPAMADPILY